MNRVEQVRRRIIARILAVNDTCQDEQFKKAMRAVVMSAVNEGMDALNNNKARKRPAKRRVRYGTTNE